MRISVDVPDEIYKALENGDGRVKLQEKFDLIDHKARFLKTLWDSQDKAITSTQFAADHPDDVRAIYSDDSGTIEVTSGVINTLEQALEVARVDLEKWDIERHIINSWQVHMKVKRGKSETGDKKIDHGEEVESRTNYQVKVWLKPKTPNLVADAVEHLINEIPKFKFKRVPRFTFRGDVAAELWPIDAHLGKMAWGAETGREDYDLKISCQGYENSVEGSLSFLSLFSPSKIIFGVGQDLMHIENYAGTTPGAKHILDTDSRFPKVYDLTFETVLKCVYLCRDVAPVEVIWIPGNHDVHASRYLCHSIKQHFNKDRFVNVDISPSQRKARLWGNLLVGWTHDLTGRHHSWANELAQAWPDLWGKSKFREWHHGHKHKKAEVKTFPVMTQGGVLMRQLTALSPIDAWHYEHLFTDAVPGCESFIWSKKYGVVDNHIEWTVVDDC